MTDDEQRAIVSNMVSDEWVALKEIVESIDPEFDEIEKLLRLTRKPRVSISTKGGLIEASVKNDSMLLFVRKSNKPTKTIYKLHKNFFISAVEYLMARKARHKRPLFCV